MNELFKGKCLILTERECFPLLFKLKAKEPNLSWKILDKESFLDRTSFSFSKDPIPYLLSKKISYGNAKKYLRLLRVANWEKNTELTKLYGDLSKGGYLQEDPLGNVELSRGKLVLLEMQEDQELHLFLKRKGIAYVDASFKDLGLDGEFSASNHPKIYSFPNKFAQFFYIYSDIRRRILEGEDKNAFRILIHDPSDIYYVQMAADCFGLPSYATYTRPFLSDPIVKAKVNGFYASKSMAFGEEEPPEPSLKELKNLISYYGLGQLPFDFAYACLLEMGNTLGAKEYLNDRGISIETRYTIDPDATTYVTNFQFGDFYTVYDDKNVLSDEELVLVEANPSYVRTKMDRQKKRNYLGQNSIALLSFVRQHLQDKIYESQFLEECGLAQSKDIKRMELNPEGAYTSDAAKLYLAEQLDRQFYRKPYGEYRSYDHSFKGLSISPLENKKSWSITNLEKYINCPFAYYLKAILPETPDNIHSMAIGSAIHKMMENVFSADFDFDKEWEEAKSVYVNQMEKEGCPITPKEETWTELTRFWISEFVAALRASIKDMHLVSELPERPISFELHDEEGNSYLFKNARIDKLLVTEDEGKKYYTIIDYKSGKESFDPRTVFLGASTQLPLYYYAIEHSGAKGSLVGEATFGGFGICHCYESNPKQCVDGPEIGLDDYVAATALQGIARKDIHYMRSFDATGINAKGDLIDSGKTPKKGDHFVGPYFDEGDGSAPKGLIKKAEPPYTFKELIEDARKSAVETIRHIKASEFPIAPTSNNLNEDLGDNTNMACQYCPYNDICYRNLALDAISKKKEIAQRFGLSETEEGEEEDV